MEIDFSEFEQQLQRQDSLAEMALVDLFGLIRVPSRMAAKDAIDEIGNPYQLKASTKSGVSTVRDFGPKTIEQFRSLYFIIAWGRNLSSQFLIQETFFLAPYHLEIWLQEQEAYFEPRYELREQMLQACEHLGEDKVQQLQYIFNNGMRRNDPNIPKSYIRRHGIQINDNHPEELRRIVQDFPLGARPEPISYNVELFS